MLSQFDHKFLRKLLEASWIRVQLISPIGDLKHILGRNKHEIVRRIRFKRGKEVLKVNKRLMDNRGALRQIVAAEIERRFQPRPCTNRMRSVGYRKIVAVAEYRNTVGKAITEGKQILVRCLDHAESLFETSFVQPARGRIGVIKESTSIGLVE
jgi:hypothetical protein